MSNQNIDRIKAAKTQGEVMDALLACTTQEEAVATMNAYREINPHADENVGYMLGYYDLDRRKQFEEWLGVAHPIFGKATPTAEEAFAMGGQS